MTQASDLGAIANQSRTSYRGRVNTGFQAVATQHSGASAPSPTYANHVWFDTSAGQVKLRNPTNTSWATIGTIGPPFVWTAVGANSAVLGSATLSGTSVTVTGVPAGCVAFDLGLVGVAVASGNWNLAVQLGTSSGLLSSGYSEAGEESGGTYYTSSTTSFNIGLHFPATSVVVGGCRFFLTTSNRWIMHGITSDSSNAPTGTAYNTFSSGTVVLPGTIDRVALLTNGGGNFNAGIFQMRYFL